MVKLEMMTRKMIKICGGIYFQLLKVDFRRVVRFRTENGSFLHNKMVFKLNFWNFENKSRQSDGKNTASWYIPSSRCMHLKSDSASLKKNKEGIINRLMAGEHWTSIHSILFLP